MDLSWYRNHCLIEHVLSGEESKVSMRKLFPFFGDIEAARKIARIDEESYFPEEILDQQRIDGILKFKVKWYGYEGAVGER